MIFNENKAGIYIHIPFCRKACHYCNFHFSTSLQLKDAFLSALKKEITQRSNYLPGKQIQSIYFGGGTPSVLTVGEIQTILDLIYKSYSIEQGAEITLEANPDDIDADYLAGLKKAGINRMSIGIQSFYDRDLLLMNRSHSALQAEKSLSLMAAAGFKNITADLIYGIPGLSHEEWEQNIKKIVGYDVNHISCYALTVEPKTALQHLISKGTVAGISETHTAEQFEILTRVLNANNFEHYEISNFAKNGAYAIHNSSYWLGNSYYGFGPSAHSYNGKTRSWNMSNNALYIQSVQNDISYFETETLDLYDQMNECIMTSLRTMWGLNLELFEQRFGVDNTAILKLGMLELIQNGNIIIESSVAKITPRGKILADGIISDLFFTD
jgi:oxygen-independent coproporphyrinogen III oxidase